MKKIIQERKDILFYIKLFPLKQLHPEAYEKSKAILCEKSLTLLEDAFAKKAIPKPSCNTTAVDETIALAQKLGISGTPASILPDGRVVSGAIDAKTLLNMIGTLF
jgi:thiol:disulfide interchange protein DsbC